MVTHVLPCRKSSLKKQNGPHLWFGCGPGSSGNQFSGGPSHFGSGRRERIRGAHVPSAPVVRVHAIRVPGKRTLVRNSRPVDNNDLAPVRRQVALLLQPLSP
jgi:hypothetical protein